MIPIRFFTYAPLVEQCGRRVLILMLILVKVADNSEGGRSSLMDVLRLGYAEILTIYNALWRRGDRALRRGMISAEEPPTEGSPRWGVSVVIRVPGPIARLLTDETTQIRALSGSSHLYYEAGSFHITVRSLEGYRAVVPSWVLDQYIGQVARSAAGLRPRIELRGLCASEAGILVCGYSNSDLGLMRRRLADAADGSIGPKGVDDQRIRNTAHVSLVVFQEPTVAMIQVADRIARSRWVRYGMVEPDRLQLVQYEWTSDGVLLHELAHVDI